MNLKEKSRRINGIRCMIKRTKINFRGDNKIAAVSEQNFERE